MEVIFLKEADEFLDSLPDKARKKVVYNILQVKGGKIDNDLFKKLGGSGIWEFRTLFNGMYYRLFAFWDSSTSSLVVATHGIIKKSDKTPTKEIKKAQAIMKSYLERKIK